MSKLRIGLAVEGPTDAIVLRAGLTAFLKTPFVDLLLQPEVPIGTSKTGWGGVFRWCRQIAQWRSDVLSHNPTLQNIDLIVIQVDADVAQMEYASSGIKEKFFDDLPCEQPCPPASDTVDVLHKVVCGWLFPTNLGNTGIICIPSKCIEAWVLVGLYSDNYLNILRNIECSYDVISILQKQPAKERLIRSKSGKLSKNSKKYHKAENMLTLQWENIKHYCPQAQVFQNKIENALSALNT